MWKQDKNLRAGSPVKPALPLLFFERMEPKILLSADALGGLVSGDPFAETAAAASLDITESISLLNESYGAGPDPAEINLSAAANDPVDINALAGVIDVGSAEPEGETATDLLGTLLGDVDSATASRQEIIFVDAATPDYETLLEGIADAADTDYQVVILQSGLDGINQMTRVLNEQQGIDAIHLVSHGNQQGLQLGNAWLSSDKLDAYSEQLLSWGEALDPDADLLIYGCELAADEAGRDLLSGLATFTGADVAASNDLTGAAGLGGDWQLEYTTGIIESQVAIDVSTQQAWSYVLGTITVTTTLDVVDGDADLSSLAALAATPGSDGFVSLREAIIAANTDTISGLDEINLGAGTYALTLSGNDNTSAAGDLDINDALIIRGVSAATTIIDGDIPNDRVFDIRAPGADISNLTITNGGSATTPGGGLRVTTGNDLTLTDVIVSNNEGNIGGALQIANGTVTLNRVVFDGNTSSDEGGAIFNADGVVNGTDVSFFSNSAAADGGGVFNKGDLTLDRALFFDNSAAVGGAIHNEGGNVTLTNATLSANTATSTGGAINNQEDLAFTPGVLDITNSTFTANTSAGINGIFQLGSSSISLVNSILNDGGSNLSGGLRTTIEYNIDSDNSAALGGGSNLVGDPMLDVLADNGGFAPTHALLAGSIAINPAGLTGAPALDQRGISRDAAADIGAFEAASYLDQLLATSYSGNDGTLTWSNDWQEIGEANGAAFGSVSVWNAVGEQGLYLWAADGIGIWREADLSAASSAILSFDWAMIQTDVGDTVSLEISTDGGVVWTPLDTFVGPLNHSSTQPASYDISAFIDNDTQIKFETVSGFSANDVYFIDNVAIQLSGAATPNNATTATNLSSTSPYNEGDASVAITDIVVSDVDSFEIVTATLTLADITTGSLSANDGASYSAGTGVWTITGTVASVNIALANLVFNPTADNDLDTTIAVNIDDGDEDGGGALTGTITLDVTPANDDPALVNNTLTLNQGDIVALDASMLSATDVDNVDAGLTFTVSNVINGYFAFAADTTTPITGFDQSDITAGNVRFVHDGGEIAPTYDVSVSDGTASTVASAAGTSFTGTGDGVLWLTMGGDEGIGSGIPGVETTDLQGGDVLQQAGPGLTLGEANTDGVFSIAFNASDFAGNENINGIHYVTSSVTIGGANAITLQAGDLILTNDSGASFASNGAAAPPVLVVGNFDLFYFRPDTAGDYSKGNFYMLLSDAFQDGADITAVSLVEKDVFVGDYWLRQGDLLLGRSGGAEGNDIWLMETGVLDPGDGATYPAVQLLIEGDDLGVDFNDKIIGLDILEQDLVIGGRSLDAGTLLVSFDNDDSGVGLTLQAVDRQDIAALAVLKTTLGSGITNSIVTASLLFDGHDILDNDVNMDSNGESIDGFTLTADVIPINAAPSISPATPVFINELHYDNTGIDSGEAIELMGLAGTDLTGWSLVLYSGADGLAYDTLGLSGTIADQSDGYGTLVFNYAVDGIQNGGVSGDGIALVNASSAVVQFISYEGTLIALDGAAAGMASTDIGVAEDGATAVGDSLQLSGTGSEMTWTAAAANTFGSLNSGQTVYATDSGTEDVDKVYSHTQMLALLGASDIDDADADLTVNISNVVNGSLALSGGTGGVGTTFTFTPALDFNGQLTIDYQVRDDDLAASTVGNGIITFAAVNDAPNATNLSSTSPYNEGDLSVAITDIVVSDVDTGEVITATLTLANTATGSLSANDGASYSAVTGVWTITDSVANVNTALANLAFAPAANNDVDTTISVSIDDGDEDASGALTGTITLDVTPINDAPTATNLSSTSLYNEGDATVAITDIVVSDVDTGEVITATLTLANTAAGSLSANDGATYSAITGVWTITDSVANVNTALANLAFAPAANNDVDTTIGVSIDDGDEDASGALTGTITLDVTPINDAPTATNLSSTSPYNEGDASVAITDIVVSDVDTGEVITATLTLANTVAGSLSANDGATYSAVTGVWTITDSVANVNTALANLAFAPNINNDVDTTIGVSIDDGDEDASGALTGTITLDVTPVNDAPTATNLSSTSPYNEGDASVAITDIVVSDVDTGEVITATLTLANTATGSLSANDGASYSAITGVWTITDSVANVNTALANLAFAPNINNDVDTTIGVSIDDGDEDASGALTGTITLDVTPVNDAPTATNLSSTSPYNEGDASVAITDIVVSDVDTGEVITATLTLANTATGSLSANDGASYSAITGVWTITDSVANVNTALANLAFAPAANNDVDTTIGVSIDDGDEDASGALTGTITLDVTPINDAPTATNLSSTSPYNEGDASVAITDIVVSDVDTGEVITATLTLANTVAGSLSANDGATYSAVTGVWTITDSVANVNTALANLAFAPNINNDVDTTIGVSIDDGDEDASGALTGTITLDVTPVNDAPTATNLSSTSPYNEGDASVAITDIVVSDVDTGEVITATLTLANTATGSLSANDGASYSAITGVWTITDSVANVNTALANLAFAPAANNDVDTTIGVNIDDGDEDASGALTGTITLDVTPVNDAPNATNLSSTSPYNEGDASVAITDIVVSDVDTGEVITATLTLANTATGSLSANDGASYSAVTGVWTITDSVANVNTALANLAFAPNTNNDVDTTIGVSIDDGDEDASGALTGTITLDVTPVNDAPSATNLSSTSPYNEGDASVAITDIVVSDVDTGEVITATLTLANTATGSLSANDGASYSAVTGVWTITDSVANVNTALANLAFAPAANNDVDTTISVSIDDGDEDASGALTGTITLDVTPINDAPTATNLTSTSPYNEGDASVAITDIVVSDVDTGEVITATLTLANTATGSLSANDGATYSAITGVWTITDSVANVNTALANLAFAPNTNNDVDTTIGVSIDDGDEDASGALTGTITLDVTPVNDAPTATNLSSTSPYNEGDATVAITDIVVSDVDTGEIITATLTLANTAAGSLSANDGASYSAITGVWTITDSVANVNTALANLVFSPVANNEVDTSISVSIDDGDEDASGALTGTITLDVTPVNDAPTATNLNSTSSYNEGDLSVAITDIVISDIDAAEIVSATLTLANTATGSLSANDGATYSAVTGVWTITGTLANVNTALANLQFSPSASNDVDTSIGVSIDDGDEDAGGPLTGTITLDVSPANDPPTATNLSSASSYTEGDLSVAITNIVVSDIDTGEMITATLTLANPATGSLSANDGAGYSAATGVWSITDTLANVNTALANLVFNPALNNELDTSISVNIDDGDEDASGALTGTITLTVSAVNDAPTATNLFDESRFNDGDTVVPLNNIVISDPDIGETVTATLTLANINAGSLSANNGASYDAVTGLWTITGTVAQVNTALANLTFIPAVDNALDTSIAVSIDDGDEDGSGPLIGALTITVNPLPAPELPVIEVVPDEAVEPEAEVEEAPVEAAEEEAEVDISPVATAPVSEDFAVVVPGDEPGLPEAEDEFSAPGFAHAAEQENDRVRVIEGEKLKPAGVVILLERLEIQLQLLSDPLQLVNTESFIKRLNDMRQELVSETRDTERVVGSSLSVSAGLSVGYVIWLARSGVLLSSVLSSLPAWRFIDPLPVLAGLQSGKGDENDESLESMVEDQGTDDEIEKTPWEENKNA